MNLRIDMPGEKLKILQIIEANKKYISIVHERNSSIERYTQISTMNCTMINLINRCNASFKLKCYFLY